MDSSIQDFNERIGWDPNAPGAWVLAVPWDSLAIYGTWRAIRRSRGWARVVAIAVCWLLPVLGAGLVMTFLGFVKQNNR